MRLAAFLTAMFLAGQATGQDVLIPSEPTQADIPAKNFLGERIRGIRFPATLVLALPDEAPIVMFGYIVGRLNGDANFVYMNKELDTRCEGKTIRAPDGSGQGQWRCVRAGALLNEGPFKVLADKYMKRRGETEAGFDGPGGQSIVLLRWGGRSFPEPQPMLDRLYGG